MTFRAVKVIYQLVVGEYDDDGNLVAEHLQSPVTLYQPQFAELEERVRELLANGPAQP